MKLEKKVASGIMLLLISVGILISDLAIAHASPDTILYIEPPSVVDPVLTPGSSFTVDVMVSDVEYLYAWQVNMSFNPDVLRIFDIAEGAFLKDQPEGTSGILSRVENEKGWALFGCSTMGPYIGKTGSGTLATVEFEVVAEGDSLIIIETDPIWVDPPGHWIYVTRLLGQNHPYPPPNFYDIPFTAEDGYFSNFGVVPSIYELIETIESWNLHKGTEKSLITKLKVAEHMLDMGRAGGAIRKLTAFIDRVETLRNKTLTNEQADYLKMEAQRIIDLIEE